MAIPGRRAAGGDIRSLEAGTLLLGAGAILLLISLFLEWYSPGLDAWRVFEFWDLALAALAIVALAAVAGRLGFAPPRPASWQLAPAVIALVVVLAALIDPPPTAAVAGRENETGIWLALAGALLMAIGAVLSVARISIALNARDVRADHAAGPAAGGGRFAREPVDPGVAPASDAVPGRGAPNPPTAPTRTL